MNGSTVVAVAAAAAAVAAGGSAREKGEAKKALRKSKSGWSSRT